MLRMAHKEERFLFVIYPLLCLAGGFALAVTLDIVAKVIQTALRPEGTKVGEADMQLTSV